MQTQNSPVSLSPRKIIVLTCEHIGDLVCTTPALRSLRRLYPDAHITVEVGERAACVLENNPFFDELILRPDHQGLSGRWRFIRLLQRRRFDLGIVLEHSADLALFLWLGQVPERVGILYKKKFAKLYTRSIPFLRTDHEMIDHFRDVVALLGGDVSDRATEVFPDAEDCHAVEQICAEAGIKPGQQIIALNPGASAPANRWLPERFAELGDLLSVWENTRVVLLGGPSDVPMAEEIQARMKTPALSLTNRFTVLQLAEFLRRCTVVVTGDTGPMHLAVAMQTPVVALFGPAVPSESGPGYAPGHTVIRKGDGCPSCTKYECREDRKCMRLIAASEVADAVQAIINRVTLREK